MKTVARAIVLANKYRKENGTSSNEIVRYKIIHEACTRACSELGMSSDDMELIYILLVTPAQQPSKAWAVSYLEKS